jgi:hypothetical protein
MKHCVSLPHHKVLEPVTTHFEVNTKVIHNSDVISEVFRCREVGEPATLLTFWEVNPSTPWGRCSHRSRGAF